MKIPNIDLDELKKDKKKNFKERLKFIEDYSNWLKKKSDKDWSTQQKKIIG